VAIPDAASTTWVSNTTLESATRETQAAMLQSLTQSENWAGSSDEDENMK
jgi:hypothetical protein